MSGMSDLFPDDIPWLSQDQKYLDGVEVGALLMLCKIGAPMVKMKIHPINEDQIRVGASHMGYHVCVDHRDQDWTTLTLAVKSVATEEDDDGG